MKFKGAILRSGLVMAAFLAWAANAAEEIALGKVKVDARARKISFGAEVNQRAGAIEYLVVHEQGKVHESSFKTPVSPREIHAAALLFKGTNAAGLRLKTIDVLWSEDGKEKRLAAADLILDKKKGRALRETKWAYRGSRLVDGVFLAEREGSIVAVREDRDALVDQDTPDAADDENWEPLTALMPLMGAKVTIEISFGVN